MECSFRACSTAHSSVESIRSEPCSPGGRCLQYHQAAVFLGAINFHVSEAIGCELLLPCQLTIIHMVHCVPRFCGSKASCDDLFNLANCFTSEKSFVNTMRCGIALSIQKALVNVEFTLGYHWFMRRSRGALSSPGSISRRPVQS